MLPSGRSRTPINKIARSVTMTLSKGSCIANGSIRSFVTEAQRYLQIMTLYASSVNSLYSDSLISLPAGSSETVILAIQASPSGSLLMLLGVSSRAELTSATVPLTGVRMSEADLTDSTAPMASPSPTSRSTWGSSM